MKIRYDFVTNSSSTSFVVISDGEFNFRDFVQAVGIDNKSAFIDIYQTLFDSFQNSMQPIREYYRRNQKGESFADFVRRECYRGGDDLVNRILDAEKAGKEVYIGHLSSDRGEIECFFCTDEFIIDSNKIYIDAQDNSW